MKSPAVSFSVDDVHPAVSCDPRPALDRLRSLQERHPQLKITLFTTPDWRSTEPVYGAPLLPEETCRLDRHSQFCELLRDWPNVEVAVHGLSHVGRGANQVVEFDGCSRDECARMIRQAMSIFESARLSIVPGMSPPGWIASDPLLDAMLETGMRFVASARDLTTPIERGAKTSGSGLQGVSLIEPERLDNGLIHFTTNFQATSANERAFAILDRGGLLAIKAHLLTGLGSYRALDGVTDEYMTSLDRLFSEIEERYGEDVWWTSMGEIAGS
jgi:hypothetical protein